MRPPTAAAGARPAPPRKWLWPALAALVLLLLAGGYAAYSFLNRSGRATGSRVVDAPGQVGNPGPLVDRSGPVAPVAPPTEQAAVPEAGPPADVLDYLAFLKEIERRRVALVKTQSGEVLNWSSQLTAQNLTAEMGDNPEQAHRETYQKFQQSLNQWAGQWQQISGLFLTKQPPASCVPLRDRYYDMLGKTAGAMAAVGNSMSTAMSGDPSTALGKLSSMQGSASKDVDDACAAADQALADVCDKFKIHKDFDIKAEGGGSNPFGVGR